MRALSITVLYDGAEDEEKRKVEAEGGKLPLVSEAVAEKLSERGHEVRRLAAAESALELARQIADDDSELVFNICESFGGKGDQEQNVAALLELFGKRFTGSGSIGLALAQDKALAKMLLGFHDIQTPKFTVVHDGEVAHADDFGFPMFVKPTNSDSSIGIDAGSVVRNVKELMERISWIESEFDAPSLIEEYIEGREIYVGVLGGEKPVALPVLEWDLSKLPDGSPKIASQDAKFDTENAAYQTPLREPKDLGDEILARLQAAAVDAFKSLKLRDYGRVDMRLREGPDGTWEFYLIEVNPNPHLAADSEMTVAAGMIGMSFEDLLEHIAESALARPRR